MDAGSDSGREFPEPDEAVEAEFARMDAFPHKGGGMFRADGKGSDVRSAGEPNTPRSKHSATEQLRRSKINDRFQILRDLIPHSHQKRDKASFLLEVIEYIRYLQEKVQKYEAVQPGWNQENIKSMPWNSSQGLGDPSIALKNENTSSGYTFPGKFDEHSLAASILPATQNPMESEICARVHPTYTTIGEDSNYIHQVQRMPDSDNPTVHPQSRWFRPSPCLAECTISGDPTLDHDELIVDEGTISFSNAYSHGVLSVLNKAMQKSGVDLSQASISVQINFGKRVFRTPDAATKSTDKDIDGPSLKGYPSMTSRQDLELVSKRHKPD